MISGSFFFRHNLIFSTFAKLPTNILMSLVLVLNSRYQYLMSCAHTYILMFSHTSLYRLPMHVVIIILCFIIALLSKLQKQPPGYLNSFILYILLTITTEIIAWWYSFHNKHNLTFYNFYAIINFTYLIYLLRSFISNRKVTNVMTGAIIIYPIITLINAFWIQGQDTFNTYTFLSGCILVVTASIFYFYERIKHPGPHSLLIDPTFWVSTGLLFFYTCSPPLTGVLNAISLMPFYNYKTLYFINIMINIILYLLFSISFICNLIFRKSS